MVRGAPLRDRYFIARQLAELASPSPRATSTSSPTAHVRARLPRRPALFPSAISAHAARAASSPSHATLRFGRYAVKTARARAPWLRASLARAGDHHVDAPAHQPVEHADPLPEPERILDRRRRETLELLRRELRVRRVRDGAEAEQHFAGDRRPARHGVIERILRPMDERLAVVRREEEPFLRRVPEARLEDRVGEGARTRVARVAGRLEEIERGVGEEGVIVEEALPFATPSFACRRTRSSPPRVSSSFASTNANAFAALATISALPSAPPASASAPIMSPFQLARIFSSRNGFTRVSRASNIFAFARASAASTCDGAIPSCTATSATDFASCSTVFPLSSKFPSRSIPQRRSAARAPSSSPARQARTSLGSHTKNFPSSPSLSASCVA